MKTRTMRVGAVENAGGAFSKAVVGAFCASTMPPASSRHGLPSAAARWFNPAGAFVEAAEPHGTEMQVPFAVVNGLKPDVFADQHRADDDVARVPRHHPRVMHAANFPVAGIDHWREYARHWTGRRAVETRGRAWPEGFMRPIHVVVVPKTPKALLLGPEILCRWPRRFRFQGAVHPLVRAVLIRRRRRDQLGVNPQTNPPDRQARQAAQRGRREGLAVIRANP